MSSSTVDDQRALETADSVPDPRALAYEEWARCKAAAPGTGPKGNAASSTNYDDACPLPPAPQRGNEQDQDPGRQPTTQDILYAAATVIHADGAGLYKRPLGVSYTNKRIPTIVSVTNPTQTHVINLLGHDITITLTATQMRPRTERFPGVVTMILPRPVIVMMLSRPAAADRRFQ